MSTLASYRREIFYGVLLLAFIWAYESIILGGTKEKIAELKTEIDKQKKLLPTIREIEAMTRKIQEHMAELKGDSLSGSTLVASIERIKDTLNLSQKMRRLKAERPKQIDPKTRVEEVDLALSGVSLNDLVNFLKQVELLGPSIRIKSMTVRKQQQFAIIEMVISAFRVSP